MSFMCGCAQYSRWMEVIVRRSVSSHRSPGTGSVSSVSMKRVSTATSTSSREEKCA